MTDCLLVVFRDQFLGVNTWVILTSSILSESVYIQAFDLKQLPFFWQNPESCPNGSRPISSGSWLNAWDFILFNLTEELVLELDSRNLFWAYRLRFREQKTMTVYWCHEFCYPNSRTRWFWRSAVLRMVTVTTAVWKVSPLWRCCSSAMYCVRKSHDYKMMMSCMMITCVKDKMRTSEG